MGVHVASDFVRLMDSRLKSVMEDRKKYNELKTMIPTFYKMETSDSAWEEYTSISGLPDIPRFNGRMTTLSVSQGFIYRIEPAEFGAKVVSQRKLIDDNKYPVLRNFGTQLVDSMYRTREKYGVKTFGNATSTAFDFMVSEEGVALVSTAHLTKVPNISTASGFSNSGTSAMSKTSVAATWILMRQFKADNGERFEGSDNFAIVCPINKGDHAREIVGTAKGLDTAEGNINPQYKRYQVIEYPLLDNYSTTSWYMVNLDLMKEDLIWLDRIKPETNSNIDFNTLVTEQSVYSRWGYGHRGWRWVYGHTV